MCHLVLFMPVFALPIFWIAPLNFALPIYLIIALISGLMYWLIVSSMRKRPVVGAESLPGTYAEVVSKLGPDRSTRYLVRSGGELWTARCKEVLKPGENVNITTLNGIILEVQRVDAVASDQYIGFLAKQYGMKAHERHCH